MSRTRSPSFALVSLVALHVAPALVVQGCGSSDGAGPGPGGQLRSMTAQAGVDEWALPGAALPRAPAVLVRDADSNAVAGVPVIFAVTGGGGTISGGTAVTDASGIATVGSWTLGGTAGVNTLTATAVGLDGSPVEFRALGTTDVVPRWPSVTAGGAHSCVIAGGGAAYCWGRDEYGQLGVAAASRSCAIDGTAYPCDLLPRAVQGGHAFAQLDGGPEHTCGLTSAGAAYCWGRNNAGQVGDSTSTAHFDDHQSAPSAVLGGLAFTTIVAGALHSCALTAAGAAYCWGANPRGQLGDGTRTNRPAPVAVLGGHSFVAITIGGYATGMTCALTAAGAAWCWGENSGGQLGIGQADDSAHTVPQPVAGGVAFATLSASPSHVCGLTSAGSAWCWGQNVIGSLGDGTTTPRPQPTLVAGGHVFTQITTGGFSTVNAHSCAITATGEAWCWGDNGAGAVGDGTRETRLVPTRVAGPVAFASLSAGYRHTCARSGLGVVYCWGSNGAGQLGVDDTNGRLRPTRVQGLP